MEARFRTKFNINAETGCWDWTSSKGTKGYGQFSTGTRKTQKIEMAHRAAWILFRGDIPEGMVVRHKCRHKCVNPDHLELGTPAENAQDMVRDGTRGIGARNSQVKLTEEQVQEVRRREGENQYTLADEFGVSQATISNIYRGRVWTHLPSVVSSRNKLPHHRQTTK
jgi:DNA-binding XRE family transcriptional regulator